jgi:hypothetical protein
MSWHITGLPRERFAHLFTLSDAALAEQGAVRVAATSDRGFPCRITLEDARAGETLLLLNYTDHDVATPYRNSYAIHVREGASGMAEMVGVLPPVLRGRPIALRGYDADGMLRAATLALDGVESGIEALFANEEVATIHAHNAAYGCFAARITRAPG